MSDLENASPTVYSSRIPLRSYAVQPGDEDAWEGAALPSVSTMTAAQTAAAFAGGAAQSTRSGAAGGWRRDPIDALEVFEHIRHLNDPEHPLSLEQLNVASLDLIAVDDAACTVDVQFTPTIPHCSMATLIGLCIRVKLLRALPARFKTAVRITPGSHSLEASINKQLADKERVAAALENGTLAGVLSKCFENSDRL